MSPPPGIAFPAVERPRASVVVVAWRNAALLERCLASLARQPADVAFETVIVLNGADDDVVDLVRTRVAGARVVDSRVNLGFGGGAHRGAAVTSTEFLVFLNDDTEVAEGWLAPLLATADARPDAGVVGSRTLNTHGQLLEAGALVWRNGSVWHLGRGLPATTVRYRYLRRVDYVSGSSFTVRRSAWDAAGGFDRSYFPGYYEDVDLCFSMARLGLCVLYEPRSIVRHNESSSLDHRYKEFVSGRNRRRFCSKWEPELERLLPEPPHMATVAPHAEEVDGLPAVQASVLAARHLRRRALVTRPRADGEGDATRRGTEALAAGGWAVTMVGGDPEEMGRLGVEVTDADLAAHLGDARVLYDTVVLAQPDLSPEVASLLRDRQRVALLAHSGDAHSRVPEAALRLPVGSPEAWPAALDEALRQRASGTAGGRW